MDVFARMAAIEADRVLDVACGLGGFIAHLATRLKRCGRVTAVDVVGEYGPRLKARFPDLTLDYHTMEGESLAFADASFDAASISYALHHVRAPATVLSQMRRVLRPGGWLIVAEPHAGTGNDRQRSDHLVHSWRARADTLLGVRHNPPLTREAVLALVGDLALSGVEVNDYSPDDRDKDQAGTLEQIEEYLDRLGAARGPAAELLRSEGRSLAARVQRIGIEAAPAVLVMGRVGE